MKLIKGGKPVEDRFTTVLDEAPLPDGPIIVPATRLLADAEEIFARNTDVGVLWPNDRRVSELAPHLHRLALVALKFPIFRDGRAYSQARLLRERYGFRGELRATGQVLRDQFLFLLRAGFDSFEITKEADVPHFIEAINRYTVFYQPTADGRETALRKRLAAHAEAPLVPKVVAVR